MKKYFAIFGAVAILGMLAIYFVPDKQLTKVVPKTSANVQPTESSDPDTSTSSSQTTAYTQAANDPTPSQTSSSSLRDGSFNGDSVSTRFGAIQVAITVSAGKITNVDFLELPEDDMRSAEISNQVSPILESQTIAAQSATIDGVSGATYTSIGYAESLQAAIDAAKL